MQVPWFPLLSAVLVAFTAVAHPQNLRPAPNEVRGSFKQHGANCPGVALAKWIVGTYGTRPQTGPFAVHTAGDLTSLTLADGTSVQVSADELTQAALQSEFNTDDMPHDDLTPDPTLRNAVIEMANLTYAAQAKKLQQTGGSFADALKQLYFSNEDIDSVFTRLGFQENNVDALAIPETGHVFGTVMKSRRWHRTPPAHVVYAYAVGPTHYYDEYGHREPLDQFHVKHPDPVETYWRYALISKAGNFPLVLGMQCMDGSKFPSPSWHSCPDN